MCFLVGSIGIFNGCKDQNETFYITPIKEISELRKISQNSIPPKLDSINSYKKLIDQKKLE